MFTVILGGPLGRPFFSFEKSAAIPLTNAESIPTLFRVKKRLRLLKQAILRLWPIRTADQ